MRTFGMHIGYCRKQGGVDSLKLVMAMPVMMNEECETLLGTESFVYLYIWVCNF